MGNCNFQPEFENEHLTELNVAVTKNNFQYHYAIGKGGFGKVWKVERKKDKQLFAMKEMSKARVLTKRSVNSVLNERKILSQLKHKQFHPLTNVMSSFIVNMQYAFQDRENLYLVMDLLNGGDLRYHIARFRRFSEEQTKFFIACILVSLEYVHNKSILHRDIKPENLVFDEKGYLRVTDFGIARIWNPENSKETSGTPGYMAPEVMCRQNHGVAVDYFAVGVIAYECMMGRRPYVGKSRKEIRDHILAKQVQIKRHEIPPGWSIEGADFINKLIQRKPQNRLGLNGPNEVKNHPWLKSYPWQDLSQNFLKAPFIPANKDNFDAANSNSEWKDQDEEGMQKSMILLRRDSVQELFNEYYYDETFAALQSKYFANITSTSRNTAAAATTVVVK
ncbi:protein kinase domain containing protein [Stylonychia lemnae]|uniref:non-specific serine/threonine protein kinase n=1 Tax=Stylonychia lemnae TaxID=5949 RepID=A0A078AV14_STYLE|nr:protein kinase domain containing protein [Stylonychia lemnae]|eukprot:CDW85841.1 protein kinase domain containing protein [Stylonychia lemnae]